MSQEKACEVREEHSDSIPAVISIADANIVVGKDLLLGSQGKKEPQLEEYCSHDTGTREQIIPTNIAKQSDICAVQEEVLTDTKNIFLAEILD